MTDRTYREAPRNPDMVDGWQAASERVKGKRVGVCKICRREFRIPYDTSKWLAFNREMITHPLEHDQSAVLKRRVNALLAALENGTLAWAAYGGPVDLN
jgi:hypothetical protein